MRKTEILSSEGSCLSFIKRIYRKISETKTSVLNGGRANAFLLRLETGRNVFLHHFYSSKC
jgi:hypothetical protein